MEITLSSDTERFIRQQLQAGEFGSAGELVEEAISLLRDLPRWTDAELRHEIKRGVDQLARSESDVWDAEDVKRRLRSSIKSRETH